MKRDGHDRLEAQFDNYRILRRLRCVPPHEVYEVRVDGRRAVYKADTGPTGNAAVEGRVTAFVGRETSLPVPEVISVGTDHYVAAWHPEAPAPEAGRTADRTWADAAGRALATLHEETEPFFDRYGRLRPRDGAREESDGVSADGRRGLTVDGTDDWHAAAVAAARRRRRVLARYGHADAADAVETLLCDRPDAFDGAGSAVCCHGWFTPEHVAVADDGVVCAVDFEHAVAAPAEYDYWRTVLPAFGGGVCQEAFREAYESVRTLPTGFDRRAPFYVLLNELYYLQSLHVQDRHGPEGTAERAERFRENVFERVERLS